MGHDVNETDIMPTLFRLQTEPEFPAGTGTYIYMLEEPGYMLADPGHMPDDCVGA